MFATAEAGVFSQIELAMIRTLVRSGMANAKAKGKQIGRPQVTVDSIPAFLPPPLSRLLSDEMDRLMEAISPEARKQLENIGNLRADMTMLSNEDYFIYGFRLGARMMLDVLGEYEGQFYSPGE